MLLLPEDLSALPRSLECTQVYFPQTREKLWKLWRWKSRGNFAKAMPTSSTIHVLQLLRELLAFVLLSYTVLIGALLLAGWTTYFLVLK